MPEITSENISVSAFVFNDISVYLYMSGRERANGTYHRDTGRHCESPERREHEMNNELMERIRFINRKAEKAKKDGYTVADGFVWEGWGNPTGPCARKVCKVEDYEQDR